MREYFARIKDPRQAWKVNYNLLETIVMTICAVISGREYWEDIADFRRVKEKKSKLEILEVKGCIVTIDAMGYQREIAEKIVNADADYVLSLVHRQA